MTHCTKPKAIIRLDKDREVPYSSIRSAAIESFVTREALIYHINKCGRNEFKCGGYLWRFVGRDAA